MSEIDTKIMSQAICGGWPQAALPDGFTTGHPPWSNGRDMWSFSAFHPALFRDSGLAWLALRSKVEVWRCKDEHWHLYTLGFDGEHNDSLLFLIDSAIRSLDHHTPKESNHDRI